MRIRFRWFHANICSNPVMADRKVIHDVLCVRRLGRNGGFNEIKPSNYKRHVAKVFGSVYNLGSESPQTVNPHIFKVLDSYRRKMHGGFMKMTPVREVSVIECETHKGHLPVAFVESHYINKGMHIPKRERKTPFRNTLHLRHFLKEQALVVGLVNAGFTVFGAEDTNERHMPKYHPDQVWVHNEGIDKMWYIPASDVNVTVLRSDVVKDTHTFLNTDHPALTATIELEHIYA